MITRITKQNRAKYEELFASATKALKNQGFDVEVSSLEDYFANLGDLKDISPKFIRLPLDEDYFLVDLNTRKITIPTSFKSIGLGVQGDHLAEVIYFKVDRYFDTTDLGAKDENKELADGVETYILWENAQGQQFLEAAYNVDVTTENDKMIFGWPVSEELTRNSGNIKFSVVFIEANWNKDEDVLISIEDLSYRLSTLPTTINVNTGLSFNFNTGVRVLDNSELKNRITNKKPLGDAIPAPLPQMYEYNGYDWLSEEPKVYDELSDLVDNEDSLKSETALTALAYPESGAGIISYEWYKNGKRIDNANSICLKYKGPRQEGRTYYTIEGPSEFRILNSSDDFDELMGLNRIYEKIGFCNVTAPGEYSIKVTNRAGRSYSTIEPVGRVIIPGPTALSEVKVAVKNGDEIFVDGEELVLVASAIGANAKDTLHYLWNDGSTGSELKVNAAGTYSVDVWSSRNGGTTIENKVNASINIYAAAISPSSVEVVANAYIDEDKTIALLSKDLLLTVSYSEITQEGSSIKVQWQWQSLDGGEWINLDGLNNNTLIPSKTGVYRAVVTNEISSGNSVSVESNSIFVFSKE